MTAILLTTFLLLALPLAYGNLEAVLERCCQSGHTWALNHTTCTGPPQTPGSEPPQDRLACLTSLYICCIRAHRRAQCERGKQAAIEGTPCPADDNTFRDCCEGCRLGLRAAEDRLPCSFLRFSFGHPWDQAYLDCCEHKQPQPPLPHTDSRRPVCEPNAPCSQICEVRDGRIQCSCYPGYKLAPDRATCQDVDECELGTHTCHPDTETCSNVVGGFSCMAHPCPAGFHRNRQTDQCQDVDECEQPESCPGDGRCVNTYGSFYCDAPCTSGFVYSDDNGLCVDVDECGEGVDNCNRTSEICQNSHGGYQCIARPARTKECPAGFKWNDDSGNCEDVDECSEGRDHCNRQTQNCVNAVGSYRCVHRASCPPGFAFTNNKCQDVDECALPESCPGEQTCRNTVGSYTCSCPEGFLHDQRTGDCKDVNECQLGLHACAESQRCDNTLGSYTCVRVTSCGTGYTLNAATGQCEDDDECALQTHNCGPGFRCRNIQGSFRCDRVTCPPGQKLLPDGSCKLVVCAKGLEPDAQGNCADVNECARREACRSHQRCVNTVGSFYCQNLLNCSPGYELDPLGTHCVDVDECARRLFECGVDQTCRNRPGGYTCECARGYALNLHRECEDVDECVRFRGQVCSRLSECINTQGSYVCNCKQGFRKAADDNNCLDVDECAETPNLCQQTCNNVWGSYQCSCQPGYTLGADNRSCQDVDECETYSGQGDLCIGICVNEPGSFSCSCPPGYRLSSDKRTCQDIDECQEQGVCSGEKEVCLNTRGGYKCNRIVCPPHYVRDNDHRNRCKKAVQECPFHDSECLSQPKSFSYNYITFVSNIRIPLSGQLDLFTMRGPRTSITTVEFDLQLKGARAPEGLPPATREFFHLRRTAYNEAMVSLVRSIQGPQEIELDLVLKMYHNGKFAGNAVAKIFVFVSEHKF